MLLFGLSYLFLFQPDITLANESEGTIYEEIQKLGLNCSALDSCNVPDRNDDLSNYNCHCGSICYQLDTCCADSPYRSINNSSDSSRIKCHKVSKVQVFMIDSCHPQWTIDSPIAQLCLAEAESENDPMLMIPVTSLETEITYKNYFCFVCNGENDTHMPTFWPIQITGVSETFSSLPRLSYDHNQTSWAIEDEQNGTLYPISLSLSIPHNLSTEVKTCRGGLVSECAPNWTEESVRKKCSEYMGIVSSQRNGTEIQYRNVHCAICNFDDLQKIHCEPNMVFVAYGFSLTQLLDVNMSGGEKVGKVRKCANHLIFDPFFNKCRVPKCALPGYKVRNGKCVKS